ncbi:hypothetical protein [Nostoc sp.]|uniref:hypothetical protein n=1 Tax=Nostoc sp. TaxID=1180 RepID=UPI002FFA3EBB
MNNSSTTETLRLDQLNVSTDNQSKDSDDIRQSSIILIYTACLKFSQFMLGDKQAFLLLS